MKNYVFQNLKFNFRKFILMLILLIACCTFILFTIEVISNLIYKMNSSLKDLSAKDDIETMIIMLYGVIGLIIGFSYLMVDNTYSIILHGREKEFNLLYNLGFGKEKIKKMLNMEGVVIGTIAVVVGSVLSFIIATIFMDNFDLEQAKTISVSSYLIIEIMVILVLVYLINRNIKTINIGINDEKHVAGTVLSRKQINNYRLFSVLGTLIMLVCVIDTDSKLFQIFKDNALTIQSVIFWGAVLISLNGYIYLLLIFMRYISKKNNLRSLYIASEQNIFSFKKIKSVIVSLIIAVVFLVGFQGLYESIRETTKLYIKESIDYDYMIICNKLPEMDYEQIKQVLDSEMDGQKAYSIALTANLKDSEDKNLTITGMDDSYKIMQKLYVLTEGNINDIYSVEDALYVLFPSPKSRQEQWGISDTVSEYKSNGKTLDFRIAELYDPINLRQGFTSRIALSNKLYGIDDKYNTLYFKGISAKEVDAIITRLNLKDYSIYDMETFRNDCIKQVVNGTEIIEAAIYISLLFVASMVVNIFVLSYSDRIKQYAELMILGTKKKILIVSMLIESTLIYIIGVVIGFTLSLPFIKGALSIVKNQLVFDTIVFIPYDKLLIILTGCFIGILLSTVIIGIYSLNGNILKFNYKE